MRRFCFDTIIIRDFFFSRLTSCTTPRHIPQTLPHNNPNLLHQSQWPAPRRYRHGGARACWLRSGEGPAGLYLNLRNAPGKSGGLFLQHFLYHGSKLRENNRNCFPDQLIIGGKIRMRKLVPHTGDLTPRNFRVVVGNCLRQHFDRFTNYQEIIDDCIRCFFIGHEYL